MHRLVLCASLLASVLALAKDSLPAAELPAPLGVNIHFTRAPERELDLLAATGFRIVRMDFAWGGIERNVGAYDFSAYDRLVADMETRGIRLLFILDYGHPVHTKGNGPATDTERAAFVAFARAGARHFKGKKILWEIWNEPNIPQFWKPAPNVEDYAKLAVATTRAVKEEDPEALVLAPATSTIDLKFLEGCFRGGLLDVIDVLTVHPYRGSNPETAEPEIRKLRTLMARYSPRLLPIANGEWGFSAVNVPLEMQADYLVRQALFDISMGFAFNIWYDWRDDGTDPKEPEHHFGSVAHDLAPKPASIAMKTLAETLGGFAFVTRLPPEQEETVMLLFARDKEERVVAWSTTGERKISLPVEGATIVARDGATRQVASCKEITVGSAPLYVIPAERSEALAASRVIVPCDRWLAARAGEPFTASYTLHNPFARPLRLSVHAEYDDPPLLEASLEPGATKRVDVPTSLKSRASEVQQFYAWARADEVRLRVQGHGGAIVRNAIHVRILPPERAALPVEIGVLDRSPFKGRLEVEDSRAAVDLPAGHATTTLRVPFLPEKESPRQEIVVLLFDGGGAEMMRAAATFRTAFTFAAEPDKPVADLRLILDDGDRSVPLTATLVGALGRDGGPTARLAYEFGAGWRFLPIATTRDPAITGEPERMLAWIRGDGSGDHLRCRFVDATGQTFQADGGRIDFKEWKLVEFPLRGNLGSWGGAKDGVIHYPIKWNAVLLLDSASRKAHKGEILIGEASFVYDER